MLFLTFFFSSRRRHTRFSRDWSSDVCSSDLPAVPELVAQLVLVDAEGLPQRRQVVARFERSEERRVGKECRSRWWPDDLKKSRRTITVQSQVLSREHTTGNLE